ncbi:MAG: hypothetical protein KKB21_02190 [Nanoarchaeota archaeon]|nr:hypothetical protein [Nanoarchaeota archaeon]MBU4086365.1 hypothetical protein [Nanoarchaeota archaeon]
MKRDEEHVKMRNEVDSLISQGVSIEEIAQIVKIPIGTRYEKGSAKWYRYCIKAKDIQKKAIEKHPGLYSKAGKIAQQKHPWIGKELGKKYGKIAGKLRLEQIRKSGKMHEYFSDTAKRLQKINPNHSRLNMKKAHETMKKQGTFNEHQRLAALKCKEKNPNQLKSMSKKAHELYPLALLALESHRKNYPYKFMDCLFDSEQERALCQKLVEKGLIETPIEKENIHFRIGRRHIDFFIQNKVFVEFHPPIKLGNKRETREGYYQERRKLLDENGFKSYPLVLISHINEANQKLDEIKVILQTL